MGEVGAIDIAFFSNIFTLFNRRSGLTAIKERLDRVIVCFKRTFFANASISHLPIFNSNHAQSFLICGIWSSLVGNLFVFLRLGLGTLLVGGLFKMLGMIEKVMCNKMGFRPRLVVLLRHFSTGISLFLEIVN